MRLLPVTALIYYLASPAAIGAQRDANRSLRPWLRLPDAVVAMRANASGKQIAIEYQSLPGLWLLDTATKKARRVTRGNPRGAFVWSPDDNHLIYQLAFAASKNSTATLIFNNNDGKTRDIGSVNDQKNFLAIEPIDNSIWVWAGPEIHKLTVTIPDMPAAPWQRKLQHLPERYLAAADGIYTVSVESERIHRLPDFPTMRVIRAEVAPDGTAIVWADAQDRIFGSERMGPAEFLGYGRDPVWHRLDNRILCAVARRVGDKSAGFDLGSIDAKARVTLLTRTDLLDEKLPTPISPHEIVFTAERTTDLYRIAIQ